MCQIVGRIGMARFTDKVAVVTGAGRGIGLEIAKAFAAEGGKVAVVSRSAGSCGGAADAINAEYPGVAKAYAVDISDHVAVQAMGKEIIADFGSVNILVNNAGVTRDGLLMRMKDEEWQQVKFSLFGRGKKKPLALRSKVLKKGSLLPTSFLDLENQIVYDQVT